MRPRVESVSALKSFNVAPAKGSELVLRAHIAFSIMMDKGHSPAGSLVKMTATVVEITLPVIGSLVIINGSARASSLSSPAKATLARVSSVKGSNSVILRRVNVSIA